MNTAVRFTCYSSFLYPSFSTLCVLLCLPGQAPRPEISAWFYSERRYHVFSRVSHAAATFLCFSTGAPATTHETLEKPHDEPSAYFRPRQSRIHLQQAGESSGVVILEFALVAVGIILGCFLAFDVSRALICYLGLSQIVREGVRSASSVPGLEETAESTPYENLQASPLEDAACREVGTKAGFPCGHWLIQSRLKYLLSLEASHSLSPLLLPAAETSIKSWYIPDLNTGVNSTAELRDDTVRVSIETVYNGFVFKHIPMTVRREGPYLYPRAS